MNPKEITIPEDNCILFFRRDRDLFGFMSNFHEAPVTLDGQEWRSTEFYYQAQKADDPEYRRAICAARTPAEAKRLATDPRRGRKARKHSLFTDGRFRIRDDWNERKLEIMVVAVRAKFTQNVELGAMLLATGQAEIIEDSAHDPFWGIGKDLQGENQMGRVLMTIRNELRERHRSNEPIREFTRNDFLL